MRPTQREEATRGTSIAVKKFAKVWNEGSKARKFFWIASATLTWSSLNDVKNAVSLGTNATTYDLLYSGRRSDEIEKYHMLKEVNGWNLSP
ncbi:MAG TPA: hypothetical protein ENO31_04275 [Thermoprotei archaeon]|nr:hypothetical protein [TACK group archaeon]HEV51725.1 hypothetical protein [Thermoprotei archaeon]